MNVMECYYSKKNTFKLAIACDCFIQFAWYELDNIRRLMTIKINIKKSL